MTKNNKAIQPYKLSLMVSIDGLDMRGPEPLSEREIASMWYVKGVLLLGEQSRGFQMQAQRQLKRIRDLFDEGVKTKAEYIVLEPEDFKFLKKCWEQATFPEKANEVLMRLDDMLKQAQADHDREVTELNNNKNNNKNK